MNNFNCSRVGRRADTALGRAARGRPLSAALLPLLQQLDDLSNALLGDLPGDRGVSASGDTPGTLRGPRGGAGLTKA